MSCTLCCSGNKGEQDHLWLSAFRNLAVKEPLERGTQGNQQIAVSLQITIYLAMSLVKGNEHILFDQ